jgi:hypothetical protein
MTARLGTRSLPVALIALLALSACGSDDDTAATTTGPAATNGDATTTTAPPTEDDSWSANASEHRGENGERFTLECSAGGTAGSIWGVETYTDDSSICTAAVHVGLITLDDGGEVEYEITPGLDEYDGATGNGILSSRYPAYDGSFIFPDAPPGSGDFTRGSETWQRTALEYADEVGREVTIDCAPGGPFGSVWGTGTYTGDSSVCTAAVHAGLITVDDGGTVTFEVAAGADSYEGTTANGVESSSYPAFTSSFTFPEDQ